jgi:hypothetical protein
MYDVVFVNGKRRQKTETLVGVTRSSCYRSRNTQPIGARRGTT